MDEVLKIVVLGRAARNNANIKNRQPIGLMYIKAENALDELYKEIIEEELNIKNIKFTDDVAEFTSYSFKPQLRTLGRRFGKNINDVRTILAEIDGNKAMNELKSTGKLVIEVEGKSEELTEEDLLIETAQTEGFEANSDYGITVVIDTNLSDELIEEGYVREIISKVQTMRKDSGFDVVDHIKLGVSGNEKIEAIAERNADIIKSEVLADEVEIGVNKQFEKEWNINGENVTVSVEKIL